jgi:hypothetical protein
VLNAGHGTYLTVDRPRGVKGDQGKDYGHEGRHTRKRVDLRKGVSQSEAPAQAIRVKKSARRYTPILSTSKDDALG